LKRNFKIVGKLRVNRRGFGFVEPLNKDKVKADVFIPKRFLDEAIQNDIVEVEVNGDISPKGPEGKILKIVKRSTKTLYCIVVGKKGDMILYSPVLKDQRTILLKKCKKKLSIGDRIIVKVTKWQKNSIAVLEKFIGNIKDPSLDVIAASYEHNIKSSFLPEEIKCAKSFGKEVSKKDITNRKDLTEQISITIDPTTAKDYDDAISLNKTNKGYVLFVHIADVANYVPSNSVLDNEANYRCNSTYFPGTCIPMLPEELSNNLCSLKEGVVRLSVTVEMHFDMSGNLKKYDIYRSAIKSHHRFTYEEAYEIIQKKKKSNFSGLLCDLVDLGKLLKEKRMERGSVDFSLPDTVVEIDKAGVPTNIKKIEYDISHQIIEEFMLKANEVVATHLGKTERGLIYRIHESPSNQSLDNFFTLAKSLGFKIKKTNSKNDINDLFSQAKGTAYYERLSISYIRSMKLAQYSPDNIGHFGLSLENYCHFTSPIRRYSDLVTQRLLFNEEKREDLKKIAIKCSEKERESFDAESGVTILKKLRYLNANLKKDPHHIYTATVTKISSFAIFFDIDDFYTEGIIYLQDMTDDYYIYEEKKQKIIGKHTKDVYKIGTKIKLILKEIDLIYLESDWQLA
jgi:ribonuclease R